MEHNVRGCSRRPCCSMWVCVSLLGDYNNGNNKISHSAFAKKTHQQAAARQTDAVRHRQTRHSNPTLWTYQVWSSSNRRYREEEEDEEEEEKSWTEGEWRGQEKLLFVCSELACFSVVLNFDRLRLLLWSVSLLSHGQGRRDDTTSSGKGGRRGVRGSEGWGGPGWAGGEGRSWLRVINIHQTQMITVSQLETDGRALAGHSAILAPLGDTPHKHKHPSSYFSLWSRWWQVYSVILSHSTQQEKQISCLSPLG